VVEVRPLQPGDDRTVFESGNLDIDRFFKLYAGQNQFRLHLGVTWIAVDGDRILGFATVSASHIEVEDLPSAERRGFPRYPLPVLRLARIGVDRSVRNTGVGGALLRSVCFLAREMSEGVGCVGIVVDAKPEAVTWYERYGFRRMPLRRGGLGDRPEPVTMFLPLGAIPG